MAKVSTGTKMSAQMRRASADRVGKAEARLKRALEEQDKLRHLSPAEIQELQAKNNRLRDQAQAEMPQSDRTGREPGFNYAAYERTDPAALAAFEHGADLAENNNIFVQNGREIEAAKKELKDARVESDTRGRPDGPFKKLWQRFNNWRNGDGFHDNETLGQRAVDEASNLEAEFTESESAALKGLEGRRSENKQQRDQALRHVDAQREANFMPAPLPTYKDLTEAGISPFEAAQIMDGIDELEHASDEIFAARVADESRIQSDLAKELAPLDAASDAIETEFDQIKAARDARSGQLQEKELVGLRNEGRKAIFEEPEASAFGGDLDDIRTEEMPELAGAYGSVAPTEDGALAVGGESETPTSYTVDY
jgi:hypothetical protein